MKLAIIGWYGTETIGDRAILAGLIKMLLEIEDSMELYLGSIYPFFSERTVSEDMTFYKKITGKENINIKIFDSRSHKSLTKTIKEVDCIAVGGGPLLDVSWMYMLEYAFMKAKKHRKKSILLGCGLGPLTKKTYLKSAYNIIKHSDVCIFRDVSSLEWAHRLVKGKKNMYGLIDPAVFAAVAFSKLEDYSPGESDYIAVNLREFPMEYAVGDTKNKIDEINQCFESMLLNLIRYQLPIKLIPMHYFSIGGDDRKYLNQMILKIQSFGLQVQNDPLTLEETLQIFKNAKFAIGMRFHSVVLQTICNGNNYVLDYTNPTNGKIGGFLRQIGGMDFYKTRYFNIQETKEISLDYVDVRYHYEVDKIEYFEKQYKIILNKFLNSI